MIWILVGGFGFGCGVGLGLVYGKKLILGCGRGRGWLVGFGERGVPGEVLEVVVEHVDVFVLGVLNYDEVFLQERHAVEPGDEQVQEIAD